MNTKWLWYINISLLALSGLVLIIGLALLSGDDSSEYQSLLTSASLGDQVPKSIVENKLDDDQDSPLVTAISIFSQRWEPPVGSVKVTIEPQEALAAGAQWKVDNGPWQKSGSYFDIPVGSHVLSYQELKEWLPPQHEKIEVGRRQKINLTAVYKLRPPPEYGSLTLTIEPNEVIPLGAKWRVGNASWNSSGDNQKDILVGTQIVSFKPLPKWDLPKTVKVEIIKDQTTNAQATYTVKPPQKVGSVKINLEPPEAVAAQAQWRIKGADWNNSGSVVEDLPIGEQIIEFKPITPWTTPEAMTVVVETNKVTEKTTKYTKVKPPAPKFLLQGTMVVGADKGWAWIKTPEDPKYKAYIDGELVAGYLLSKVSLGEVVLMRDGYEYPLKVTETASSNEPPMMDIEALKKMQKNIPPENKPNEIKPPARPGRTIPPRLPVKKK